MSARLPSFQCGRARLWLCAALLLGTAQIRTTNAAELKPFVIELDVAPPTEDDSAGGIVVADLNGDRRGDFLVTTQGHLSVHDNDGRKLWSKKLDIGVGGQSESQGLPGHHGPGVTAADVDGDGRVEVLYITRDGRIHSVDGASGKSETISQPPVPKGAARWELVLVASFREGKQDRDVLLQATNKTGYRTGRYLAAYAFEDLVGGGKPLWSSDDFSSCAHNGARLADLDGDGRDEVLGATILSPTGKLLAQAAPYRGHMDSVFVADVRPELPGLEAVLLEEGSNYVQVLNTTGVIWRDHYKKQEPQNAAIGRFRPDSDEVLIWCRTRYNEHQKPFVLDAKGHLVSEYALDDVAPKGWTARGVEVIHTIDWSGERHQLACAKERHRSGDVCLFEPLTGKFVRRLTERADRLYVYDVRGDWREEIIVLNGRNLHVYENPAANPRPDEPRLWLKSNYRRLKQAHNYYSP